MTVWTPLGNDSIPDCTIAACGHAVQLWTGNAPSAESVQSAFKAWCSGECNVGLTLWRWWWNGLGGHHVGGFATLRGRDELRQASNKFGCAYVSMKRFMDATDHTILVIAMNANGLTCVSWGAEYPLSWADYDRDVNRAYAIAQRWKPVLAWWCIKNNWKLQVSLLPVVLGLIWRVL